MKAVFATLFVLFGLAASQYLSIQYTSSGCSDNTDNDVDGFYIYPANGECFVPTTGTFNPTIYTSDGYIITVNDDDTVTIDAYEAPDCSDTSPYNSEVYTPGACNNTYYVVNVWEEMPDASDYEDAEYTGYYGPWETILSISYFTVDGCDEADFTTGQVYGFETCTSGGGVSYTYFCDDGELNYQGCASDDCSSDCVDTYEAFTDDCTVSATYDGQWYFLINEGSSGIAFQATCLGGSSGSTLVASVAVVVAALALVF